MNDTLVEREMEILRLQGEKRRLREALEIYANDKLFDAIRRGTTDEDPTQWARQALNEIKAERYP